MGKSVTLFRGLTAWDGLDMTGSVSQLPAPDLDIALLVSLQESEWVVNFLVVQSYSVGKCLCLGALGIVNIGTSLLTLLEFSLRTQQRITVLSKQKGLPAGPVVETPSCQGRGCGF